MRTLLLMLALAVAQVEVQLPADEPQFAGPDADLLNGNCAACHSAEMIFTQPRMTEDQWRHSVEKMRTVYKAPITDEEAAKLPAALVRLQGR
jgi:cytochrome c553